jgi:hypothetical protein
VVNNITVSCYAFGSHNVAHWLTAPLRFLYSTWGHQSLGPLQEHELPLNSVLVALGDALGLL